MFTRYLQESVVDFTTAGYNPRVMTFQQGENVGPYQIVKQLGRGGMATVYKAYHAALDRYVAIKGLHAAFLQDPNFKARFQREARLVAKLEHPNIVQIFDFNEHNGQPYLVLKYIEGETLKARLTRSPLPRSELLRTVEAVGSALDYAHQQGILHRDIKPSNVLLDQDGGIYLTDFGLARMAGGAESTLSADMMLGTPQYISPEQALGKVELDEGTDIYSFGIMLYELTVGEVPFSADTPYSIVHDHIYSPLPMPSERNRAVPEPIEKVLLKALAKKREDRYASVGDLVAAFVHATQTHDTFVHAQVEPGTAAAPPPVQNDSQPASAAALPAAPTDSRVGPAQKRPKTETISRSDSRVAGEESAAKRRRRWWWLVPVALVFCLCGFIFLSSLGDEGGANSPPSPVPAASEAPVEQPTEISRPQQAPTEISRPQPAPPEAIPLERALRQVALEPDNPYAHLDLAIAFWDAGNPEKAQLVLEDAFRLGAGDLEFLRAASDALYGRELWLESLLVIGKAVRSQDGFLGPEMRPRFEHSLYNAALDPRIRGSDVFSPDMEAQIEGFGGLLVQVALARSEYWFGSKEEAVMELEQLLADVPDFAPARLLSAEILFEEGDPDAANRILRELLESEPPSSWVTLEARKLMFLLENE